MASPPDERIPRPDQNFISRGLAKEHGEWEREWRGGEGRKWGERMETRLSARKSLLNGPFHGTAFSSSAVGGVGRTERFRAR